MSPDRGPSKALLTDLYQLTMAWALLRSGRAGDEAVYHLFFRKNPFGGGFAVACGLEPVADALEALAFDASDLRYLASLATSRGAPLFPPAFLDRLAGFRFRGDVDAVPEGTVVFPFEPLLRIRGPMLDAQIVETLLLNIVNFQTLIATKAARLRLAAGKDTIVEFGLRRAQGPDGGLSASRAAFVGGADATSNVLAGKTFGIPVRGTHAHSWVMAFESEIEAFRAYADALPDDAVFLVDTYDTLEGVRRAIEVGHELRRTGHELGGVRLDSGDLAWLSQEARKLLDDAGFAGAAVVASNDLDERLVKSLKAQGAAIGVWGVGTNLATGGDQSALGGVYKLSMVRRPGGAWRPCVKVSEQAAKTSNPGILQVRRYLGRDGRLLADVIYDEDAGLPIPPAMIDPLDATRRRELPGIGDGDLLVPLLRGGRRVAPAEPLAAARERAAAALAELPPGVARFENPHAHPVGLEAGLHRRRTDLVLAARRSKNA